MASVRALRHGIVLGALSLALVACGGGGSSTESGPTTTPSTAAIPTTTPTTSYTQNPCFKFPVEVLRLQNDWRLEQRGIREPDKEPYRRRAQALVDEARQLGCAPLVGLSSLLRP